MFHFQHANLLRVVVVALIMSLQGCAEAAGIYSPPPADISSIYGNTVQLEFQMTGGRYVYAPTDLRLYVTKDGTHILSLDSTVKGENRGVTYGRDENLCIEHQFEKWDGNAVLCGLFTVRQNGVTLHLDRRFWDENRSDLATSVHYTTIFTLDAPGRCSFVRQEMTGGPDIIFATKGKCRVLEGRQMNGESIDRE